MLTEKHIHEEAHTQEETTDNLIPVTPLRIKNLLELKIMAVFLTYGVIEVASDNDNVIFYERRNRNLLEEAHASAICSRQYIKI
jgi:hypothetical protein